MSEFDQLYREVILDHYKNPRGHGLLDTPDAQAEGQNPLCGDEVAISLSFDGDGETIADVKFRGRGCAISQAATSLLMEIVKGRTAAEVAGMPKEQLLEEVGIPLTPVRLKCARSSALAFSRSPCIGQRGRRSRRSGAASTGWSSGE